MKQFLGKCLLLLLATCGTLLAVNWVYTHGPGYQDLSQDDWYDAFQEIPESVDVAVFGASHGKFSLQTGPERAVFCNFSMLSEPPFYNELMLREYGGYLHPGSVVVITVSSIGPFWTTDVDEKTDAYNRYYSLISLKNTPKTIRKDWILHKIFPILFSTPSDILHAAFGKSEPNRDFQERNVRSTTREEVLSAQENDRMRSWEELSEPNYPEGNPVMLEAYRNMLSLCRENEWQAIFMTPPYLQEYNDAFPAEFNRISAELISQLAEEYNVPYYNYAENPAYFGQYDWFLDSSHLNAKGAKVFEAQFYADCHMETLLNH